MYFDSYPCFQPGLQRTLELIGGRWKALLICELSRRPLRYAEIVDRLAGISHRVLTFELKFLEKNAVVKRIPSEDRSVQYRLTAKGQSLLPAIRLLSEWAQRDSIEREEEAELARGPF